MFEKSIRNVIQAYSFFYPYKSKIILNIMKYEEYIQIRNFDENTQIHFITFIYSIRSVVY